MYTSLTMVMLPTGFAQLPDPFKALESLSKRLEETVRSESQSNMRPSMAGIDRQQERSMSYDNQIKHVTTFFEKRKLNRMYRAETKRRQPTREQLARYAKAGAPDRLTSRQYQRTSGRINWLIIIRESQYDQTRRNLTQLFRSHAKVGGTIHSSYYASIQTEIETLNTDMKAHRNTANPDQYAYARKFLRSLNYEARFPSDN